jgi:hypothetical protein
MYIVRERRIAYGISENYAVYSIENHTQRGKT